MSQETLETMLTAWRAWVRDSNPVARDVALDLADRSRRTTQEVKQ